MNTDTRNHNKAQDLAIPQIHQVDEKEISHIMQAALKTAEIDPNHTHFAEVKIRRHPHILRRSKKKIKKLPKKLDKAYVKLIDTWKNEDFFITTMIKFMQGLLSYTLNHPQEEIQRKSHHRISRLMDDATRLLLNAYNRQYPALERMVNLYQFALSVDPGYGALHDLIEELKAAIPGLNSMTAIQIKRCNECHNFKVSPLFNSLIKYYTITPIAQAELRQKVNDALAELINLANRKNPQYSSYVSEVKHWYKKYVMKQRHNLVDSMLAKGVIQRDEDGKYRVNATKRSLNTYNSLAEALTTTEDIH